MFSGTTTCLCMSVSNVLFNWLSRFRLAFEDWIIHWKRKHGWFNTAMVWDIGFCLLFSILGGGLLEGFDLKELQSGSREILECRVLSLSCYLRANHSGAGLRWYNHFFLLTWLIFKSQLCCYRSAYFFLDAILWPSAVPCLWSQGISYFKVHGDFFLSEEVVLKNITWRLQFKGENDQKADLDVFTLFMLSCLRSYTAECGIISALLQYTTTASSGEKTL